MKYIFHLGRIPALSIAEIQAVFKKIEANYTIDLVNSKVLILDIENKIDFGDLLPQMGGTIKISEVFDRYKSLDEALEKTVSAVQELSEKRSGKKIIGYSIYFTQNEEKDKALEILEKVKRKFTGIKKDGSENSSIRIVPSDKNGQLNSASVFKNKMIKKGAEFNFLFKTPPSLPLSGEKLVNLSLSEKELVSLPLSKKKSISSPDKRSWGVILSKTVAIQDIKSYSERDYNRPKKDTKIGIMPPKLAQIMINLAQIKKGEVIFDPFCGIGTVLQEALLNDYKVIGSDANGEQIENSKKNLAWLSEKYILEYPNYKLFQSDIKNIIKKIKRNSIDAIVTESTLGPVYRKVPSQAEIKHNYNRFVKMYTGFFQIAKLILRKKRRIVITIPAYKMKDGKYITAPFIDRLEKIGYSVTSPLEQKFIIENVKITNRNSIIYDRPNQIVAREVFVFENK
ncbi:MAG: DNA methyltransferase [Patescibacteria group bacterium]|nr:DNA methyltransferase [Patescibacteria group bacterium]